MIDLLWVLALLVYFVPGFVAVARKHPNTPPILILNTLLGWTVLGWIGALIWACSAAGQDAGTPSMPQAEPARRPCPDCAEAILPAARICPHCRSPLAENWAAHGVRRAVV